MSSMKFCRECNNLMMPKEDEKGNIILNACRICGYWELVNEDRSEGQDHAQNRVRSSTLEERLEAAKRPMRFCRECRNLMLPKADKEENIILKCRLCDYQELVNEDRSEGKQHAQKMPQVPSDVAADPTLPQARNVHCPECNNGKVVIAETTTRGTRKEERIVLVYACCNPQCRYQWTK